MATTMKKANILALLAITALTGSAFGQQKLFQWIPAENETIQLDPAFYHNGRTYHPGPSGGNIHVDIEAKQPVTISMTPADQWKTASDRAGGFDQLNYICVEQHVVKTTYTCSLPPQPMVLVVHDERQAERRAAMEMGEVLSGQDRNGRDANRAITAGIGAVLGGNPVRKFVSPNDVSIQYYRWDCVENCYQPEYQWVRQVKEKYELTDLLKVYGGIMPDHDGEQVSIKLKSPVPMAVAILPAKVAGQLYGKPDMFESAVEGSACQQRGVQSTTFQCAFNVADGPQALVLLPEPASNMHSHKKAEVEVQAVKCVANCTALAKN